MFSRLLAVTTLALGANVYAGDFSVSSGLDYSRGSYGESQSSETWYLPVIGRYEAGPLTLKLTLPYLRTSGPVTRTPGGPGAGGAATVSSRGSASGQGDVVTSAGYALLEGMNRSWMVEVIGKVKLPTADKDKGLGSGKTDYSVQLDLAKPVAAVTVFGTAGWKKFGDPDGMNMRDPLFLSVGLAHKLGPAVTVGAAYDWRQKVTTRGYQVSELSVFVTRRLAESWKMQTYFVTGFSDASPDMGGGLMLTRLF